MGVANYFRNYIKIRILHQPTMLILYVTNMCNMNCRHCFVEKRNEDISLDIARKLALELPRLNYLLIGGGEPFLSANLVDVCRIFDLMNRTRNIQIPTNGYLTGEVIVKADMIKEITKANLTVAVSIDGIKETHNHIRNNAESFERAITTIKELKKINVNAFIVTTLNNLNYKEIYQTHLIAESLEVKQGFEFVRGTPSDSEITVPPLDQLDSIREKIKLIYKEQKAGSMDTIDHSISVLKGEKTNLECLAGKAIFVVYVNGDVSSCELLPPAANLKGHGVSDIQKLLSIPEDCRCTHTCFTLPSILYRKRFLFA
jgi:MoaA/NifB/PqqE/SkfB family radical SAM enzyme